MKFFPSLLCSSKWTLCLCLLLPTVSGLYSQTNDLAKLNERRAEIQGLLNDGIILEAIRKLEDYLQQRPDDLAARKQICQAYLDLKDYFKLRYHTRIILQEFPEDSEALAWSATADKIIAEKYAVMVEDLLDALKDDPENTVLRRELISLYMTGDEGEKAAEQFHILLERQPDDEALWLDFARNLFWSDQPEESLVAYQQYLAVAEEPKDVRLEIARVHAANADFGTAVDQLRALIKDVPGNFDASSLLGDIYRWNDDAMAAEEIYRAVLLEEPDHGPSLRGLEELANMAQRKVITTASMNIESMREKVEDEPENMDILLQLARLYTTKNRYAEGAEAFDQYLENQPDDLPVRREYAFTLSILERYDEAIRQLRLYLQEFPDDMTERMRIARMLLWQGKNEAAKRELLEMEAIIPDNPELHWNLARIYEIEADWPQAIARYEALREVSPRFEVASAKIRAIESNPYYRIATMERRIEADASDTAARLQLARIFLNLDRFYEAQEQAQAVLDYEPDQEQASRILGQAEIGVSQARRNRIEELKGILAEDTENFEAMLELARYYRDEVDYPEALRYYYSYLKAFPQDRQARLEYARVLSWQPEQRESAISEYAILIEDQPENIDLRLTHLELLSAANALTAQETVLMAEIEDALRQQLSTNSEDAEALLFMGRLYQINSKWPEALDFYSAAIAASDRDQQGTPIADRIESILALPDYQLAQLFTQVEVDPSDVLTRLILARQLFDLKRYYEAREQASRLLDYDPGNVEASRIIGWAEIGIEEVLTERIRTARSDIRENPQDMEATLELARSLKEAENYPESLIYYYQYLKANPDDVGVREEYAQVLSWDPPQLSVAVQEYGVLSDVRPDDIALQVQYYDLVNRLGELSDRDLTVLSAIEDSLRERILLDDQDSEALFYLGRLHQIDENWKSAIEYYEAAIAAGDADSTIRNQIDTILALPDFRMARLFAEVEANPSDVPTRLSLARQLFDLERYYEAREQAIQLLAYDPGNIEATRIVGWSDIGIEEIVTERIRTARAKILKNPQDMEVALELARLLREAEVYPEALRYFYHYLQAYPDDLEVREEYAQVLSWEPSQLPGAVRELGILAEMRPDDMALQLQYYELLNRVGELSDYDLTVLSAIEDRLRERVFFNDQDSEALFYLGRLHQINANWNSAIEYYQAAIAAGIEDTSAQDRIESMLAMPDFQLAQFAALVEANPSDVRTRLSLANQLFDLERYYEAREQATQALAYDPDNVEASRIVGWSDIGIEKVVAERIRTARGNITRNPQDMGAALELARLLKDAENYPESLRYYYHYLQAYPDDLVVREEYAQVLSWEPSQLPGAVRELGILAEMRPDDMELQLQYYELLNRERDLSDYDLTVLSSIEDRLRERVFFNDQDSEALFYLGRLHQINTNWNSAIEYYQAAIAAGIQDTSVQNRIESMLAMPDFQLAQLFAQVEANPSAVPSRLSLARQLFDLERYYEAREQANQVLAFDPGNVEASRIIARADTGIAVVQNQRMLTARSRIAQNPQDVDAALELARLLRDAENYPESLRYYYDYLAAYPDDIEVREEYAQVLSWEPSQLPSAVRELAILAEMRPEDLTLQLQYYELLDQQGELNRGDLSILSAIEDRLRERVYFNNQDSEALFYLGRLHQIEENWNSALDYYEAAIAAGNEDTSIRNRIASISTTPDFQIASLEAKVANNPNDIDLRLSLVQLLLQSERYYAAQEQAQEVLQLSGSNREAREMYNYASQWIEGKQVADLQNLRFQVTENPRDLDAQLALARMIRNEGAYGEAAQRYRLYLQAYPEDLEVRREYADTLAWSGKNSDAAISEYKDLLFAYPNDRELKMQYARMLSWNPKYWNEADEVLEELAMLDGNNPEILIMQADILRFRGRYGAAQLLYDQVLEMGGTGFYGSGQRFGDERFVAGDQRNTGEANVAANRPSLFQPYVFNNQRLESEDFRPNNVIYEDFDRRSNQTPARTIYRPISDEEAVRRYRDTLLNTTPDSPRNSIRYPQGSLPPQAKPDVLPSVSEQDSASAHASSGSDNSLESVPFPEVMPEATAVDTPYGVSAHFTGEKTKWRRPKPEDYKIVLAAMVMNSTDDSSRGASIAAKPPTNALLEKGGYEPSRRGDSIKMARPSERPRHAERDLGTAASMTRESMAPPERYVPGARVGKRDFLDEESQSVDSRSVDENALRTYAIPGDGSVRVEQSLPVDTRPETVERVIYREPVYQVRPELGSQRVVEYVTEPNRRLELPRRNLDQRLMFDETPIATRAPLRRTESQRVELPFEPLPEPPRFYPERDRGVDTRTGTSLPPPTMYNRRAVNDRMSTPVRNSNSRALRELERFGDTREPVRNTRERVAPRESRDSDYDSRSILPPPTPFIPTAKGNREGQSSLILRETERPRSNNTFEADMNRRSRLIEDNGMREREMRAPLREMRAPLREMRAPVRERDFREPIPSLRKEGSNYYNSIENKLLESESLLGRDSLEPLWQAQL